MTTDTIRGWGRILATATVLTLMTLPASAEVYKYTAVLAPAVAGGGSGSAQLTYNSDTKQLEYIVVFRNLSAPPTAGHIHDETNGSTVVQLPVVQVPIGGTTTLSNAQAASLSEGHLYIDIHTATFPDGALKGAILK